MESVSGTHYAATLLHPGVFPACLCFGRWLSYGALDRSMPPMRLHPVAPTRPGEARVNHCAFFGPQGVASVRGTFFASRGPSAQIRASVVVAPSG